MKTTAIITGTPKSATMYIATLLSAMGLRFKHEKVAEDGCADWRLAPGKISRPWDDNTNLLFDKENLVVLHQVREPLSVISSCQKISEKAWYYICLYTPLRISDSLIKRCLGLYYYWNKLADKIATWTYRIEDLESIFEEFCNRIGHPELINKRYIINDIPKNINSAKPYKKLTWKDLEKEDPELTYKTMDLAEGYGYEIDW